MTAATDDAMSASIATPPRVPPPPKDAPETQIDSGPTGLTSDPAPTFTFSSDEPGSSFECRLYPAGDPPPGFAACSGPGDEHTPGALADDTHVFEVRATDPDANVDATPASRTFTVDTQAPAAPSLQETHPASPANDNSPEIEGIAEEGSAVSVHDNGGCTGAPVVGGTAFELATVGLTVTVADNTQTSFSATATDGAGNTSACSASIGYTEDSTTPAPPPTPAPETPAADTTPPETEITKAPPKKTTKKTASFQFVSEPGATYECKLDDEAFAPCTSPTTYKVKKGTHSFEVRARDAAGNVDPTPATQDWSVKSRGKKSK